MREEEEECMLVGTEVEAEDKAVGAMDHLQEEGAMRRTFPFMQRLREVGILGRSRRMGLGKHNSL
jgi:hypothetical protein